MSKSEFKAECNRRREAGLVLSGNTFPIKEKIKASGGFWDGVRKAWLIPDEETLATLKAAMPAPKPKKHSSDRCLECGGYLSKFDRDCSAVPGYHFDCA